MQKIKLVEKRQYGTALLILLLAGLNGFLLDRQYPQATDAVLSVLKNYWLKIWR